MRINKLAVILLAGMAPLFSQGLEGLKPGDKAPLFSAITDEGTVWNLRDNLGGKNVVLYFYPAAMTGGCTKQACSYRDHAGDLTGRDAVVAGISGDDAASLAVFRKAHALNFTLLSDPEGAVARLFGVPFTGGGAITRNLGDMEVILNRGVTAQRWTFIIGKDGTVLYINRQVDAENDYKAVLEVLDKLK